MAQVQGFPPYNHSAQALILRLMPRYMLTHRHQPDECRSAFAAWHGFDSPLRRGPALASCAEGGHSMWWTVDATSVSEALAQLPPFVAERTEASPVREVPIP